MPFNKTIFVVFMIWSASVHADVVNKSKPRRLTHEHRTQIRQVNLDLEDLNNLFNLLFFTSEEGLIGSAGWDKLVRKISEAQTKLPEDEVHKDWNHPVDDADANDVKDTFGDDESGKSNKPVFLTRLLNRLMQPTSEVQRRCDGLSTCWINDLGQHVSTSSQANPSSDDMGIGPGRK